MTATRFTRFAALVVRGWPEKGRRLSFVPIAAASIITTHGGENKAHRLLAQTRQAMKMNCDSSGMKKSHGEVIVAVSPQPKIQAISLPDFLKQHRRAYSIKGVLPREGEAVVYGPAESGKTFFMIDLALSIARGVAWRGLRVKQAAVVWICSEGRTGFADRLRAYLRHYHLNAEAIPLEVIDTPVNLLDSRADLEETIAAVKDADERLGAIGVIVIDTLNRTMVGGDENRPEDMGAFISNVSRLGEQTGALVLIIHHSGKDPARGARGHSSLKAAVDTEIEISHENGERVATITKARDGVSGTRFGFTLQAVELGTDEDGDPITSCVIVPTDVPTSAHTPRPRALSGAARVGLKALAETIAEHGERMPETSTIPRGVQAVTINRWRSRFVVRYGSDGERKADAVGKAFRRAKDQLLAREKIVISDPYVWVIER
jgi:KaiC/GvpD/RAD55 family RecA-like ATPase